jgi:hypothetical protein
VDHVCIGKQKDYPCNQCELVNLRADLAAALARVKELEAERAAMMTSKKEG